MYIKKKYLYFYSCIIADDVENNLLLLVIKMIISNVNVLVIIIIIAYFGRNWHNEFVKVFNLFEKKMFDLTAFFFRLFVDKFEK